MKKSTLAMKFDQERTRSMENQKPILAAGQMLIALLLGSLLLLAAGLLSISTAAAADTKQSLYATPQDAMQALINAAKAKDQSALGEIFGPNYEKLLSGDTVLDNREMEQFTASAEQSAKLEPAGDGKFTLVIGADNWPFPIPIVKQTDKWRFDTAVGMDEILNRRIGENELSAIATCRAYVLAQWEYFTEGDHDKDGVAEYAQHFMSTPGHRDGLYWDTAEGAKPSPMGALVADARAEGYAPGSRKAAAQVTDVAAKTPPARHPYHGYYFRILKSQGPHAPGGKYNYIINGNMVGGYALIAYPDKWGSSGVMTFMVNQQGRVYQKNLGPNTVKLAGAITQYDPDTTWKLVKE
jgi:hypothetical protein